ncbi:MAG TPA: FMN-binding negative transcriptional regulator [Acidobacteriaceae bacterium]|jgi:transcriptional regulator
MYIPKHFEETRVPVIHGLIDAHPLCSLVTMGRSGLFASHLPMVLERSETGLGVLRGHLSRANSQWKEFSPEMEALAIFSGPDHYITPNWYAEKAETGKVVPTWNYAVVHAYGLLTIHESPDWLRAHLETLTNIHEAGSGTPWKVTDAPEEYVSVMMKGIVGLELAVTRLEGKWKASQNRSERDRQRVAEGLGELATESSRTMKALVERR